jgi:N-acetylneuraminic acid mutarotase
MGWLRIFVVVLALAVVAAFPAGYRLGYGMARRYEQTRPDIWRVFGALPSARIESPRLLIDDKLFLFGGFHDWDLHATEVVERIDLETGEIVRLADMPTDVTHVTPGLIGDSVWIAGGFIGDHPGTVTDETYRYDISADRWYAGPPLPSPRAGGGLAAVGTRLYYFGGLVGRDGNADDHWMLDTANPEQGWVERAPMPHGRAHLAVLPAGGMVYAIGGQFDHDHDRVDLDYVDVYDPAADAWRALPPLPEPTSHHEGSTFLYDGSIVVMGGRNDSPANYLTPPKSNRRLATPLSWVYDIEKGEWRRGPNLPLGLLGAFAFRRGNTVILGGGSAYDSRYASLTMYSLDFAEAKQL